MPEPLTADRVTVAHGGDPVLTEMSFTVEPGTVLALRGPSGSGKSTILAVLSGLIPHSRSGHLSGRVLRGDTDVTDSPPWERASWLGFLAQDPVTSLCLTHVRDELALPLENAAVPREVIGPTVDAVASRLGIAHLLDRRTNRLSGGEQQRVALAATLIGDPDVVLLDEPLSMLDPEAAASVAGLLRSELGPGGPAAVVVEHRARELACAGLVPDTEVLLGCVDATPLQGEPGRPGPVLLDRELHGVRRDPDGPVVIPEVRVRLRAGTVTVLTGPNGSGKSTLLMALAGLLKGMPGDQAQDVGLVFQRPENQFVASTVLAEASYGAPVDRAMDLLERVGLADLADRNPHTLSLGQQRRLSVVAMATQDHPVLLLDEPTFGLDDAGVAAVEALIRTLRDEGRAILVATHDLELCNRLADETLHLPPASPVAEHAPGVVPDSLLARCSPVLKLGLALAASLGLLVTTALWPVLGLWALATAALRILGRVRIRRALRFQLPVLWFAASTLLVNLATRPGPRLASWGPFVVTEPGLAWGLALGARTLAIGALAALFVLTTDAVRFLNAAHQQARLPVRYAYALLAGYRLLELLPDEWQTIRAAHAVRSRGMTGGRRAWLAGFGRSAFGLLVVALRRGQQLAEALEARGLGRTPRTVWRPVRWGWRDPAVALGAAAAAGLLWALPWPH